MKRLLVIMAVLAQIVVAGAAFAAPVTVDFSTIAVDPPGFFDITTGGTPGSYTLDGITFSYDNFESVLDTATIYELGVFGSTGGSLMFDFASPATALRFDFSLPGVFDPVLGALQVITFSMDGIDLGYSVSADATGLSSFGETAGVLDFANGPFNKAQMFFTTDVLTFSIDSLSYEPAVAAVPEPGMLMLLAAGLFGLAGARRTGRQCR